MAFVRFGALGFSLAMPLLGAGTATSDVAPGKLAAMCLLAASFHVFAFVLNDVVDLELDRSEPRRAAFPLVRGVVSRRVAMAIALFQVPVSFALAVGAGVGPAGLLALGGAFVLMAVYDLFGKRTPVPWATDAVQGFGWALLVPVGVAAVQAAPTMWTYVAMAYVVVYVQMVNGVHGGLRDLPNDLRHGVRTTAVLMGARTDADGRVWPGRALIVYAFLLQGLLLATAILSVQIAGARPGWMESSTVLGVVLASGGLSTGLLWATYRSVGDALDARAAGLLHLIAAFVPLLALVLPGLRGWVAVVLVSIFIFPALTLGPIYPSARWVRASVRARRT